MHVPVDGRERARQIQFAVEHRQPGQNGKPGINGAEQEERPKAVGQQNRAAIVPQARDSVHDSILSALGVFEGALEADRAWIVRAVHQPHQRDPFLVGSFVV